MGTLIQDLALIGLDLVRFYPVTQFKANRKAAFTYGMILRVTLPVGLTVV